MLRKRNTGYKSSLKEVLVSLALMSVTIAIGLWCGATDSYSSFYIAVLIQSINNMYNAAKYFDGYERRVVVVQAISFVLALASAIIAIIHFTPNGNIFDCFWAMILITIALSLPAVHLAIEAYYIIRNNDF